MRSCRVSEINVADGSRVAGGNSSRWCAAVATAGLLVASAAWGDGGRAGRETADAVISAVGAPRATACAALLRGYAEYAFRTAGAGILPTAALFGSWRDREAATYMESPCPAGPFMATSFAVRSSARRAE